MAQSQSLLIAARFLQGIGGAMTSAVALGMIVTLFPEPREQAKAIGVFGFVASAGGSIGLLAGGVLTEAISWHWIFFVNVPIGVAHGARRLRAGRGDRRLGLGRGADVLGRGADHRGADARRLHDRQGRSRARLGLRPHARPGRGLARCCSSRFVVRQARTAHAADAAARVPLAQRHRRQRRADR